MNLKKRLFTTALIATSALTLASCGGGTSTYEIFLYQESFIYSPDMVVFQEANEYAGIELEGTLQKSDSNYDNIYTTRGWRADIVVNDQDTIEASALKDGSFVDLTNLINEHAPNLKKWLDENPTQKAWATASDGAIYGIPFYTDGQTAKAFFVRQDWVNILKTNKSVKLPSGLTKADLENLNNLNVEKFYLLLKAFKNNKALITNWEGDFYPYFDRDSEYAISELAGLWGATGEYYLDNGTVKYGAIQPEFKTAIKEIAKWYQEGLIDKNILVESTEDKRATMFGQNSGGVTHDWIGTTYSFNDPVYSDNVNQNVIEGTQFELVCIAPPTRADGTKYESTARKLIGKVTAINADTSASDQEKLIKWIDYFFTAEGMQTSNFGIEGVHWNKNGNAYEYTNAILNDQGTALENLYKTGAQMQAAGVQTFDYEEAWLSEEANTAMSMYEQYLNPNYNDLIYPNIKLSNTDYQDINSAKAQVSKAFSEQILKWLEGKEDIDNTWDKYVNNMEKYGVNTVVSILQKYV